MTLFEWFLAGGSREKSEAEMYMEQRNRDYSRKMAEYRRREGVVGGGSLSIQNSLLEWAKNTIQQSVQITTTMPTKQTTQCPVDSRQNTNTQRKDMYHTPDACVSTAQKNDSEFAITKVAKQKNMIIVYGTVRRGRFEVGDKVTLVSSAGNRSVIISSMARRDTEVMYINTSSGPVYVMFEGTPDIVFYAGDKLVKENIGLG